MTIFDLIALLITILILVILLFFGIIWKLLDDIKGWQKSIWQELRGIRVNVADTAEYTHNYIAPDVETLSNNFQYLLDGKKGIPALFDIVDKMHRNLCVEITDKMVDRIYPDKESMNKIDWDKLSKEQQDEFLKRLILPNYDSPFQPIYTPCYTPDGICMNPHGDCINCPKRGTVGTWSTNTSIKAKDAPLQEKFNDNKED